jgi:hypothetical protein
MTRQDYILLRWEAWAWLADVQSLPGCARALETVSPPARVAELSVDSPYRFIPWSVVTEAAETGRAQYVCRVPVPPVTNVVRARQEARTRSDKLRDVLELMAYDEEFYRGWRDSIHAAEELTSALKRRAEACDAVPPLADSKHGSWLPSEWHDMHDAQIVREVSYHLRAGLAAYLQRAWWLPPNCRQNLVADDDLDRYVTDVRRLAKALLLDVDWGPAQIHAAVCERREIALPRPRLADRYIRRAALPRRMEPDYLANLLQDLPPASLRRVTPMPDGRLAAWEGAREAVSLKLRGQALASTRRSHIHRARRYLNAVAP